MFEIKDSGYRPKTQSIFLLLIWELYFDKPEKYLEMLMIVMSKSRIPHWVHKLLPTQTENKDSNEMIEFFSRFRSRSVYRFLAHRPGGTYVAKQVCQDIDKKKENDPIFRFYRKSKFSKTGFGINNLSSSLLRMIWSKALFLR